jgi:hypothetical protein
MHVRSVHERLLRAAPERVGELLAGLATLDDRFWPAAAWFPFELRGPLARGTRAGHGPIRYRVDEYAPGKRLVFRFEPRALSRGFDGTHAFQIVPMPEGAVLRHVVDARLSLVASLRWVLFMRVLHDALLEDALDNAERLLTGSVEAPAVWSGRVRILRRVLLGRR